MTDYSEMTQEEFDKILKDLIEDDICVGELLSIPGVYEILSEHYNNDVLDIWRKQHDNFFSMKKASVKKKE